MARKAINKKSFEGGLVNAVDSKDLDEKSLANATNIMCDISGRVRQMTTESEAFFFPYNVNWSNNNEGASITPGYGLFCMNVDHNLNGDNVQGGQIIVFQSNNKLHFVEDWEYATTWMTLTDKESDVKPAFYFIDGGLRAINSTFEPQMEEVVDDCPKIMQYIDKTWFLGTGNCETTLKGWTQNLDAMIYPPCVTSTNTANTDGAFLNQVNAGDLSGVTPTNPNPGCVSIMIGYNDVATGEWDKDSAMKFGVSYVYRGITPEQDQESPVVDLVATLNTSGLSNNNHHLQFEFKANTGGDTINDLNEGHFDPRIKAVNLYWTGSNALGDFESPAFILSWVWDGLTYIETHTGRRYEHGTFSDVDSGSAGTIIQSGTVEIDKEPTLTYELKNPGQSSLSETTSSKFKVACISNRRTYIGGVDRLKYFTDILGQRNKQIQFRQPHYNVTGFNADRMIKSPTNKFDIFPSDNIVDVALDDGDIITALESISDRIFQFKRDILYIINVSADAEYLEEEHKNHGVLNPNQVVKTEYGIVWINRHGCYKWNEDDGIVNLIENKIRPVKPRDDADNLDPLNPEGWANFVGYNGGIGYNAQQKQIIVIEDSSNNNMQGNIMVYDFATESWTRGHNVISSLSKSNMINNFNNHKGLIYLVQTEAQSERVDIENIVDPDPGQYAHWRIDNCANIATANSQLLLDGSPITQSFIYNATTHGPFQQFMMDKFIDDNLVISFNINYGNDGLQFVDIYAQGRTLLETGSTYIDANGNKTVAWSTSGGHSVPAASATSYSVSSTLSPGITADNDASNPYNGLGTGNLMVRKIDRNSQLDLDALLGDSSFLEMGDTNNDVLDNVYDGNINEALIVNWINFANTTHPNYPTNKAPLWNADTDSNLGGSFHPGLYSYMLTVANVRGRQNFDWQDAGFDFRPKLTFSSITNWTGVTEFSIDLFERVLWKRWASTTNEPDNFAGDVGPYTYLNLKAGAGASNENWVSMASIVSQGIFQVNGRDNGGAFPSFVPADGFDLVLREQADQNNTYFGDNTANLARFTAMTFNRVFIFRIDNNPGVINDEEIKIIFLDDGAYSDPAKAGPTFVENETWTISGTTSQKHDNVLNGVVIHRVNTYSWGDNPEAPTSAANNSFTMITLKYSDQSSTIKSAWDDNRVMSIAVPTGVTLTIERTAETVGNIVDIQTGIPASRKVIGIYPNRNWDTLGASSFAAGVLYQSRITGATGNEGWFFQNTSVNDTDWNVAKGLSEKISHFNTVYPYRMLLYSARQLQFTTAFSNNPVQRQSDTTFDIKYTSATEKTPQQQGFRIGDQIKFTNVPSQAENALVTADKIYRIAGFSDQTNYTRITIYSSSNDVDGTIVSDALGGTGTTTYNHTLMIGACAEVTCYDEYQPQYSPTTANAWTVGSLQFRSFDNKVEDILESELASPGIVLQTKDYDGGNSASVKKFYKAILSLKLNNISGLKVSLVVNQRFDTRIELETNTSSVSTSQWTTVTYKPNGPISGHTFGLCIESTNAIYGFQLNDIIMHYRDKRMITVEDG